MKNPTRERTCKTCHTLLSHRESEQCLTCQARSELAPAQGSPAPEPLYPPCEACEGTGRTWSKEYFAADPYQDCSFCKGTGRVPVLPNVASWATDATHAKRIQVFKTPGNPSNLHEK